MKQRMQPSFTAVGQRSHETAGDQCQTGKVAGLQSALASSFTDLEKELSTLHNFMVGILDLEMFAY